MSRSYCEQRFNSPQIQEMMVNMWKILVEQHALDPNEFEEYKRGFKKGFMDKCLELMNGYNSNNTMKTSHQKIHMNSKHSHSKKYTKVKKHKKTTQKIKHR